MQMKGQNKGELTSSSRLFKDMVYRKSLLHDNAKDNLLYIPFYAVVQHDYCRTYCSMTYVNPQKTWTRIKEKKHLFIDFLKQGNYS